MPNRAPIPVLFLLTAALLTACGTQPTAPDPTARALQNYVDLGISHLRDGNRARARSSLSRALELDPNSPAANGALALLHQQEGELDLSEKHFRKALRSDPDFTQARNNYARFLYMQGRFRDSRRQYRRVTEDVNYRLRAAAFIGLARAEKALDNLKAAEAALRRSAELAPRNPPAFLELAALKYTQQDFIAAREFLDRFEAISQPSPRSLVLGSDLAAQFGDPVGRATYEAQLQQLHPTSRQARQRRLQGQ